MSVEAPNEAKPEWFGRISREYIRSLSRSEMLTFLSHPVHGREFALQVNAIKSPKSKGESNGFND